MSEINLTINGRTFGISCEDGQEQRVLDLGHYVDARLKEISKVGAASNESHLLVLTALMLADEIFELRDDVGQPGRQVQNDNERRNDELQIAKTIDHLASRIEVIAGRMQRA